MNERKDNRYKAALTLGMLVGLVLWVILICLKAAGVVTMHWALVLSGLVWLTWIMYACTALVAAIVHQSAKAKRWYRRRKADRRIIRQAKAAGVWDKQPIVLGGRALELKAREDFKLEREPGEKDKDLRERYTQKMIDKSFGIKKLKTPKKERHDEIDAYTYAIRREICDIFKIPPETLYGRSKTDTQDKGESENE